jgi:hypothetical protein
MPLDELVERIAEEFYRQESKYLWSLDLGLFGSKLFVPIVAREIETGNGSLWRIRQAKPDEMSNNR